MKNILVVPSFLADTYSNIEKIYIQMSNDLRDEFNFIWLVRNPNSKYERYKDINNKGNILKAKFVAELEKKGIQVIVGEISKYNLIANMKLFKKIFKKYDIDGVYAHFHFEKYMTCFFGKLYGKKVIYNEHMYIDTKNLNFKSKGKISFFNKFSDMIIAVSKYSSKAFDQKKVKVVYNAINMDDFKVINKKETRKNLGYRLNEKNVIMVAAFRQEKRHDLAFQIAQELLVLDENITFTFAGDGELLEKYKKSDIAKSYPDRIRFAGHINNLSNYYNASDVSIITSQGEAFGYSIIESKAYKIPVIALKDSGGPDEIIQDNIDGYLVTANDITEFSKKIKILLEDSNLREKMGNNGRNHVIEKFSYKNWLEEIRNIFRTVIYEKGD